MPITMGVKISITGSAAELMDLRRAIEDALESMAGDVYATKIGGVDIEVSYETEESRDVN